VYFKTSGDGYLTDEICSVGVIETQLCGRTYILKISVLLRYGLNSYILGYLDELRLQEIKHTWKEQINR
jgi:hypothetical protein